MFVEFTVVVVPLTVKLPDIVKFVTVAEASEPVSVNTVVSEPPSLTLNIIFPSDVVFLSVKFDPLCVIVTSESAPIVSGESDAMVNVPLNVSLVSERR